MSWLLPEYVNRELPLTKQKWKAICRDAWTLALPFHSDFQSLFFLKNDLVS